MKGQLSNINIRQRVAQRSGERKPLESMWKLVEQFISPYRTMFFTSKTSESSVDWRLRELFDSSAIKDNQNLAASLDGSLTNSAIQWFHYMFRQPEAAKYVEVNQWLEEVNRIAYTFLQTSNFGLEANELYLDLTSFGVGGLAHSVEETPDGRIDSMLFKALPIDEWFFDEDHNGELLNFYRKFYWTAEQMVTKFGAEGVPVKIYDQSLSGINSNTRHEVLYCVYKRRGKEYEGVLGFSVTEPDMRPYGEKYFMVESLENLGEEGGLYDMPVYVPRWRKATGSIWGWSPSMTAIYDVLTLNQTVEMTFQAGEKAIDPSLLVTRRGVYGNIDLSAAGVTVVANKDSVSTFESKARFDISGIQKNELKQAIREAYFADQLQLKDSPAMTATEVHARIQLMQRLLGPTYGRLQSDFLDKLLSRMFKMLFRYRVLPPMPAIVAEKGWELEIDYLGPLAKSQRINDAQAIERTLGTASALSEKWPTIVDNIDEDEAIRELGDVTGAPARIWKSRDSVKQLRDTRNEVQGRAAQTAQAEAEGKAMEAQGKGQAALQSIEGGQEAA